MPQTPDEKLDALRKKRAVIDAQVKRLQAKNKSQERKNDTRKKIIIGAVVMQEMKKNPDRVGAWVLSLLDARVVKPRDRALFGLADKSAKSEN